MSFFDKMIEVAKSMGVKNFAYYKKWALDHLKKQLDEDKQVTKAIEYCEEYLEKAYGVGTIRTWKGKKYIKGPDKKWRRYYDKHERGTSIAISHIMKQINALEDGDVEGLYAIIQKNAGRFRDQNGNVLPEVQQIHDLVEKKQSGSGSKKEEVEEEKIKGLFGRKYTYKQAMEEIESGIRYLKELRTMTGKPLRGKLGKDSESEIEHLLKEIKPEDRGRLEEMFNEYKEFNKPGKKDSTKEEKKETTKETISQDAKKDGVGEEWDESYFKANVDGIKNKLKDKSETEVKKYFTWLDKQFADKPKNSYEKRAIAQAKADYYGDSAFKGTDLETVAEKYASDKDIKNLEKKISETDFTIKDDPTKPFMSGVYNEDGYKIATDGRFLAMIKADYPKEDEGKIKGNADQMKYIGKKIENLKKSLPEIESKLKKAAEEKGTGSKWYEMVKQDLDDTKKEIADLEEQVKTGNVNAMFPNYKKVIPSMGNAKLIQQEGFEDFDKVLKTAMVAAAYRKQTKSYFPVFIRVGNKVYDAERLSKVMAMAKKHGLNEIVTTEGEGRCVEFKGDNGSVVIMPMARADEVRDNEFNANTGEVKIEDKEEAEEFLSGGEKETRLTFMNNRSKYETKFDKDVMDIMNHFEKQKGLTPSKYQKNHNYIRVTRNPEHIGNEQNEDFKNAMNDLKDLYKDYQDFRTDIYNRRFEEGKENRDVSSKEIKTFFEDGIKKIKDKYGIKKSYLEQIEEISKAWSQNGKHLEVVTDKNGHTRKVWKKNSENGNSKSVKKETKEEDSYGGFFATTGWDEHKIESAKRALARKQKFDGRGEMTIKDFVDTVVKEGVLSSLSRTNLGDHGRSYGLNQYDFGDMVTYKYAKYKKEQKELGDKAPDEQKTISEIKNVVKDSLGTNKCEIQTFKQGGSTHYIVTMDLLDVKNKLPKDGMKEDIKAALKKNGVDVKEIWENVHPERWEFSKKIPAKYKFNFYVENNSSGMKKSFADRIADIMQKSEPAEKKHDLEYYKKWALSILAKQKEEPEETVDEPNEETVVKALIYTEIIAKAGYPVGTIREWKGKKYIKVAPNQWKPKYDNMNRGAKMSLTNLKKAVAKCNSEEELYKLINTNASRFRDENGRPLPEVQELHDLVNKRSGEIKGKKYSDAISKIQNAGNKGKAEVDKLSQGNVEGVAEDVGDDTVNALKNGSKGNKQQQEIEDGEETLTDNDIEKEPVKKQKVDVNSGNADNTDNEPEENENTVTDSQTTEKVISDYLGDKNPNETRQREGNKETIWGNDYTKNHKLEFKQNLAGVLLGKPQMDQELFEELSKYDINNDSYLLAPKYGLEGAEFLNLLSKVKDNRVNVVDSGKEMDEEEMSNQAEQDQDSRVGSSALWDQNVKNAIKTGDVDKIKSAIAKVEKEYEVLSKRAKTPDEKEFLSYELKFRKRDAENALKELQNK